MERKSKRNMPSLLLWSLVTALVSQNLLFPVMSASFEDQKNYYTPTPDPHAGTPPSGGYSPRTPSPSHSTPSHGSSGGSYGPTPSTPKACPTPSSKSPPSGHHGGYYPSPTPTTPSTPATPTTPTTPSTPATPTTPTTPSTPSTPTTPTTPSTPSTPTTPSTPSTPTTPYTPTPSTPTTPYIPDPNSPPFTCTYWRNHPQLIWGVLGWWGTLGNAFGVPNVPGLGSNISLKDALSNTRTDAYGELCRQGTASLLNSMVDNRFAFTTKQVRENFITALGSNKAAAAQASLFKLANEGKHPRV